MWMKHFWNSILHSEWCTSRKPHPNFCKVPWTATPTWNTYTSSHCGTPCYNGQIVGSQWCPLSRSSTVPSSSCYLYSFYLPPVIKFWFLLQCYIIVLFNTTLLHVQSFPLLYAGREDWAEASTKSNSTNLMLRVLTAAIVDILSEKVDKYPLNWGPWVLFSYNWDCEN